MVVVVLAAGLGTLDRTELTVEALRAAAWNRPAWLIGPWPTESGLAERCNSADLPRVGVRLLGAVPTGVGRLTPERFRAAADRWLTLPQPDQPPSADDRS